jgi:sec-independent protein translocase protein TatA
MFAFFGSPTQMVIVLIIILLLFGHRLPGLARSLGAGITEFKKGLKDGNEKSLPPSDPGSGNENKPQS